MAYTRKDYLGTPNTATTLNGGINASTTSITITSATGWPTVSNGGFYAVIDEAVASTEEKVLVTARTGTSLTVTRGVDGTTGVSHSSGATIKPSFSGVDADEANYAVAQTVGKVTTAGDMLKASAANTFGRLAKGSNSTALAVDSGGTLDYTTVTNAMVNSSAAIALSKLATMSTGYLVANTSGSAAAPSAVSIASLGLEGGAWSSLVMTSDASATSDAAPNFEPQLLLNASGGLLTANKAYDFFAVLIYASPAGGATPGFQFGLSTDLQGSATEVLYINTGGTPTLAALSTVASTYLTAQTATSKRAVILSGTIEGSSTPSIGIYWSQGTSSANATTLYTGSTIWYRAVT